MAQLNVEPEAHRLALHAGHRLAQLVSDAQGRSGTARLCLTGGDTPREMYSLLASGHDDLLRRIDWTRVEVFWGDERHVPPDDRASNFGAADRLLLQATQVPPDHVHRIRGELPDADDAAREYDAVVRRYERRPAPTFDVMLLGLGADAHIASLFPGSPLLREVARGVDRSGGAVAREQPNESRAAAVRASHLHTARITLTPAAILDSGVIVVLTSGLEKADAVHAALRAPQDVGQWPAQLLRTADAQVEWWMDRAAASRL
jgi:6-phosphogluconolactonase